MLTLKPFSGRRNYLEVLSDILELCKNSQAKTKILRSTNTNFTLLEGYLLKLRTSGLLELQPETKMYVTTKEGSKFVESWNSLDAMLNPQKLPIFNKTKKMPRQSIHRNHNYLVRKTALIKSKNE